jgi:putative hydrolase of the HAD superfamily
MKTPHSAEVSRRRLGRVRGRAICAVTLDLWGTLFLDGPASDDRYKRPRLAGIQTVLADAGIPVALDRLDRAYATSGQWLARLWQVHRDASVREHVGAILEALDAGLPARLDAETMAALMKAYASPALVAPPAIDEGARGALESLESDGALLALVSNTMRTPGEVLRQILDRSGLLPLFRAVTFSDECGIRKPAPAIFLRTLAELGVTARQAVHVGDDSILDVEGARDAGMAVIQVTADGRATAPVKPDGIIRHLGELPAALRRLR